MKFINGLNINGIKKTNDSSDIIVHTSRIATRASRAVPPKASSPLPGREREREREREDSTRPLASFTVRSSKGRFFNPDGHVEDLLSLGTRVLDHVPVTSVHAERERERERESQDFSSFFHNLAASFAFFLVL